MGDPITIELSGDEALVLFELLADVDTAKLGVGEAEQRVLWNIEAALEKSLAEPFSKNYDELLERARKRVVADVSVPVQTTTVVGDPTVKRVQLADTFTPAVATFVSNARKFCTFTQEAGTLTLNERMSAARHYLLALYTAALSLPSVEPSDDETPASSHEPPSNWQGFDDFEIYWEVYDPYVMEKDPVAGSLSDDLLDVYRDVRRGLLLWESRHDADAVWDWKFSFDSHWGAHAVDALRALHRSCARGER